MLNNKNIGIDARMIDKSGIGIYIQHLMGYGLYDYAIGNESEIRKYDTNVNVIPFDAPIYKIKEQMLFPIQEINDAKIEIMHFPHYNVPISYQGRYVVTIHDLTHLIFPEYLGSKLKYKYAKFLLHNAVNRADHIFTVSENTKQDLVRYLGVQENNISITYNAVDDDFRVKEKKEIVYLYEKFNIPNNQKLILYVGNIKPHKNIETLLKAFKLLNKEDIFLILTGKEFKNFNIYDKIKELGIENKVIITGSIDKEDLINLYNLADVFVFPSLYEGFGIPPLEAMACGTPVIAANNSSIPEVVGNAAILFNGNNIKELSDDILKILFCENTRKDLIIKGFNRYKYFSWNKTLSIIETNISTLCTT